MIRFLPGKEDPSRKCAPNMWLQSSVGNNAQLVSGKHRLESC